MKKSRVLTKLFSIIGIALITILVAGSATDASAQLYLTSIDGGNTVFAVYDIGTDSWTTLNGFNTGSQMAVSGSGQLYAYNLDTSTIDLYDPATDTWSSVMAAPAGSSGQYGNLEITNTGEFLYTESNIATLWYTSGGIWNTLALPFNANAMGDYDPTTNQYVIGERFTTNAHMIDISSFAITDFTSALTNGETSRFGVVLGERYYFHSNNNNIHSFDLNNSALPPLDSGVSLTFFWSAAADRNNAMIYTASLNGDSLSLFDPATGTLSPLTGYMNIGNHSSLAFAEETAPPQPIPTLSEWGVIILVFMLAGSALWYMRRRSFA